MTLPAYGISAELNRRLGDSTRVIVTAPPGAGKSTVLPLTILQGLPDSGRILMLEPRRIAARQIAVRMAATLGEPVGKTVGYRIRFETKVSRETRIEVLTEGILTRMLIDDPALEGVSVVIFDEFHERSLQCDEALALALQSQTLLRDDLRIVLMSATIDTEQLSRAFDAPVIESEGRMFPVQLVRSAEDAAPEDCVPAVVRAIKAAHAAHDGDILAFLPGEGEIRRCAESLAGTLGDTHLYPLYGMLSQQEQRAAIAPSAAGERKVVLATPIAETSITIEGVRVVVDSGLCRKMVFDPRSGLGRLETVRICIDMADQRSGRAGRVAPGVCYRLWSMATEARMAAVRSPEILDADLSGLILDAAAFGEKDIMALPWLTTPPRPRVLQAQALLRSLAATEEDGRITTHGKALATLPCHPRIAQMLVTASTPRGRSLAADIAAVLEERDPLSQSDETGLDIRINALRQARRSSSHGRWAGIIRIAGQYSAMVRAQEDNDAANPYEIGAVVASAYPERVGQAWSEGVGRFRLSGGEIVSVEPSDPLAACEWIVAPAMNSRPGGVGRVFLASPVSLSDIEPLAVRRENVFWDSKTGRVVARMEMRLGSLLLSSAPMPDGAKGRNLQIICDAARKEGLSMFDFSEEVCNLQRRIAAVAAWHPEMSIPDVSTDSILASADEWGPVFIGDASNVLQLKKIDMREVVWSRMEHAMRQEIERLAPSHVTVPTGSRIHLEYRQGADAPVLRVRLQECFGMTDTPTVDAGRLPVLMELLSPGYKPVQLTSDLRSFWGGTYFEVRKELRRRYPKHSWPDDPLDANPVRGVRRH